MHSDTTFLCSVLFFYFEDENSLPVDDAFSKKIFRQE